VPARAKFQAQRDGLVVDQRTPVAEADKVAFAPRLRRPEYVVEVRVVELGLQFPIVPLVLGLQMHALAGLQSVPRRVRADEAQPVELERIREVQAYTQCLGGLVALDDGIARLVHDIFEAVDGFADTAPQEDDITVVVVRCCGPGA
jgi:hypothetical protein